MFVLNVECSFFFRRLLLLLKQLDCARADAGDGSGVDANDDAALGPDAKLRTLLKLMAKMHKLSIGFHTY